MKRTIYLSAFILTLLIASCTKEPLNSDATALRGLSPDQSTSEYLTSDEQIFEALSIEDNATQRSYVPGNQSSVYSISNEVSANRVLVYNRNSDGTLTEAGSYHTGGTGTGGGLGNQGALALSDSRIFLFAVNPGSNEISFFYIRGNGSLLLLDKIDSGGEGPVSITFHRGLIYVLNSGGTGNIAGFAVNRHGKLFELSDSRKDLSSEMAGAAQISFNGSGKALVVTEKATNTITSYPVNALGRPGMMQTFPSAGMTPFGFSFGRGNTFFVSEAAGGADNASTVSSYFVNNWGKVSLLDGPFATNASAACWVATTKDGLNLFVTNTASNDVSSLTASKMGELDFGNDGNTTASDMGPIDAAVDHQSKYLYVLCGGDDSIVSYEIGDDGMLTQIDTDAGLSDGASGLVVR
ncbi:MAG: beta-propeller fold lactonase family protein [Saprospiraceae bacterium]|nr:beta-propeller fold lactonase family protein [Saprospiraceae bacterium]